MATNNDDSLFFQGTLGQLTTTLVNAYSGDIIEIFDETFNVNNTSYDGLGGFDTMFMTNFGDFLAVDNNVGMQVLQNVELIIAGSGGDVINLSSNTSILGDVIILGGAGNDVLWGNAGNDTILAASGDDIVDGGPGNDFVAGENDNDIVGGGLGDDTVDGGSGNDILYGGHGVLQHVLDKQFSDMLIFPDLQEGVNIVNLVPPGTPNLGIVQGNLTVDFDTTVELTFRDGFAGYNNTLGAYEVTADGTIVAATALWGNVKDAGINTAHVIDLPLGGDGGDFGFFIIADGDRVNNGYTGLDITDDGVLSFVFDLGGAGERAAKITDDGNFISLVYDDGLTETVLNGPIYHTTDRGGSPDLNWDGQTHAVSGLISEGDTNSLRIGFEDLPNLGDADFEDVLFDLDFTAVVTPGIGGTGNDKLLGGTGDDMLYGEDGDDILNGGAGIDIMSGGAGSDQFIYKQLDGLTDTITDFEVGVGNDVINLTDILVGYDDGVDDINDFIHLIANGSDTEVQFNSDGDIGGAFITVALLEDVALAVGLNDLINDGNVVVDTSIVL
ncbi:MAG: hypothetical protein DHS20C02_14200 [Micavibrio sp.]|nr:MAG: hypothetical protein DHS20C02_14200 [Micavibrio sp.]